MQTILQKYPQGGPHAPTGIPAQVTDDTQMALAVGEALLETKSPYTAENLAEALQKHFIKWYHDPQNNRAPGITCIDSIERLLLGTEWQQASNISSKGCGANMRVQPVGLLPVDTETRAAIAQLQAAITHAHPTALVAAELTAWLIADLKAGSELSTLPERLHDYAVSQRETYHHDWLGEIWKRAYIFTTAESYISHGWDEMLGILDKLDRAVRNIDRYSDPCSIMGAGWVAEQAFGTAVYCFLMYPDDPPAVIRRAAASSGDSDTIACIAGAFAGVYNNLSDWPSDWIKRIEYRERIERLVEGLTGL
jgi:ADP-ribosylglycohydrolase